MSTTKQSGKAVEQACPQTAQRKQVNNTIDMSLANPQEWGDERQTLLKLIEMNQKYLIEKGTPVIKQSKYQKYLNHPPTHIKYPQKQDFHIAKITSIAPSTPKPTDPTDRLKPPNTLITGYASTYHIDFSRKRVHTELSSNESPFKYAPTFNQSSYNRDFGRVGRSHTQSAKRREVRLMGGGKLSCDTTYNQGYRLKTIDSSHMSKPIKHKNNKIFIQVANPQTTNYQEAFKSRKKTTVEESCKPKQKYQPTEGKMKYITEYNNVFQATAIPKKKDLELLSPQQLKKYVLGILDH